MKKQELIRKIEDQAKVFKSRAVKGHGDQKRHDLTQRDEAQAMSTAYDKLGWSFVKIGGVFDRDSRTVAAWIRKEQLRQNHKAQQQAPTEAGIEQRPTDPRLLERFIAYEQLTTKGYDTCITKEPVTERYLMVRGEGIFATVNGKPSYMFEPTEFLPL